jgi:apolipoprotein N-acyltransferase
VTPEQWRLPARLVAAAASGGLALLAFPPASVGAAALVALAPLALALRGASGRTGFLLGGVFGVTFLGGLVWWVSLFGYLAWTALVLAQALFFAVFGWLAAWASRAPAGRLAGVPLLYTAVEIARTRGPLGGFGWGTLGAAQVDGGPLLPLARIGGVHLVTLACVAVAALAAEALARGRAWPRLAAALTAAGLVAGAAQLPLGLAGPVAGRLDVALVQGNVPEGTFAGFAERIGRRGPEDLDIVENHVRATLPLAADPPDLVVWPENALDRDPFLESAVGARVSATVQAVGVPFIVGAILDAPGGRFRNANLLYAPDGTVVARYDKLHLVPFGEYVPWPRLRRYIRALEQVPSDGVPGEAPVVFDVGGARVAAVICFESAYPALVRQFVERGAELLVVSTNNASFRRSPAAEQHLELSRVRAVEEGRVVLHAAISGISAVINARGRVLQRTRLFEPAVLRATVPLAAGRTVYARAGDAIEATLAGAGALAALAAAGRVAAARRARRLAEAERELWGPAPEAADRAGEGTR